MANASGQTLLRLAGLVLILSAACGCFEYNEVIKINPDGSGTVEITASIPESVAKTFRIGEFGGALPAPVSEGVVRQLMTGSSNAAVNRCDIELENNTTWKYDVEVRFDSIRSLGSVKYFKQRGLVLTFSGPKELHFRQDIYPSLVQMAADEAKNLSSDPYAKTFLAVIDAPDFKKTIEDAKLSYKVVLPGIRIIQPFDGDVEILPNDLVSGRKNLKIADLMQQNVKQTMDFKTVLPAEQGFMPVIVVLLLASIIGILIPAIRLLLIKSKGGA